jgi:glucuronoarabinoxylan endo-1,4-beta-xylanase
VPENERFADVYSLTIEAVSMHSLKSRVLWLAVATAAVLVLSPVLASASDVITINKSRIAQTVIGFGASGNDSATQFYNRIENPAKQVEVFSLLYGTGHQQMGLTVFRAGISPLVCASEASYHAGPTNWNWKAKWEDANKNMIAAIKGIYPDLAVIVVPWSPPAWMKDNGSTVHGSLKPMYYDMFADFMYQWVNYSINNRKMPIKYVSIENEPSVHPKWDCCDYTPEQMDAVAKAVANAIHGNDRIHSTLNGVWVGAPETSTEPQAVAYLTELNSTGTINLLDFIASHAYGIYQHWHPHVDLRPYSHGKPILQPEVCDGKHPNDSSMADAIKWAQIIHAALRDGEGMFLFWWLASDSKTLKQLVNITGDGSCTVPKRGWVFGQYSRFMRPGDVIIDSSVNAGSSLLVNASKDSSNKVSIVVVNPNPSAAITADINGLANSTARVSCIATTGEDDLAPKGNQTVANGSFTYQFPPNSVTSFKE